MAIEAALWGTANQTDEAGSRYQRRVTLGSVGIFGLDWQPDSRIFHLARASGLTVVDWQDLILVNQIGRRFWNEVDFTI